MTFVWRSTCSHKYCSSYNSISKYCALILDVVIEPKVKTSKPFLSENYIQRYEGLGTGTYCINAELAWVRIRTQGTKNYKMKIAEASFGVQFMKYFPLRLPSKCFSTFLPEKPKAASIIPSFRAMSSPQFSHCLQVTFHSKFNSEELFVWGTNYHDSYKQLDALQKQGLKNHHPGYHQAHENILSEITSKAQLDGETACLRETDIKLHSNLQYRITFRIIRWK